MCVRCEDADERGETADCMDMRRTCPECGELEAFIEPESPNPESPDVLSCDACGYEKQW